MSYMLPHLDSGWAVDQVCSILLRFFPFPFPSFHSSFSFLCSFRLVFTLFICGLLLLVFVPLSSPFLPLPPPSFPSSFSLLLCFSSFFGLSFCVVLCFLCYLFLCHVFLCLFFDLFFCQAILSEEDRVVVIRFGHDEDSTCMMMDEILYSIAEKIKNFAVIYLVDITEVPDFNVMYELYDPCSMMFFFRNKHIMVDLGTGNNNKINWAMNNKQELIDIIETIFRGARKGRGLVIAPKDYSTKYRYWFRCHFLICILSSDISAREHPPSHPSSTFDLFFHSLSRMTHLPRNQLFLVPSLLSLTALFHLFNADSNLCSDCKTREEQTDTQQLIAQWTKVISKCSSVRNLCHQVQTPNQSERENSWLPNADWTTFPLTTRSKRKRESEQRKDVNPPEESEGWKWSHCNSKTDLSLSIKFSCLFVSIDQFPFTVSRWLVLLEITLVGTAILKSPGAVDELTPFPGAIQLKENRREWRERKPDRQTKKEKDREKTDSKREKI